MHRQRRTTFLDPDRFDHAAAGNHPPARQPSPSGPEINRCAFNMLGHFLSRSFTREQTARRRTIPRNR